MGEISKTSIPLSSRELMFNNKEELEADSQQPRLILMAFQISIQMHRLLSLLQDRWSEDKDKELAQEQHQALPIQVLKDLNKRIM